MEFIDIDKAVKPEWLVFSKVFKIRLSDGHVEVDPAFTPDDAAREFWRVVQQMGAAKEATEVIRDLMELVDVVDGNGDGDGAYVKSPRWHRAEAFLHKHGTPER